MPVTKTITGSTYLASGTPTAGNTGFDALYVLSGGPMTFVVPDEFPPNFAGPAVIDFGENTLGYFQIPNVSEVFQSGVLRHTIELDVRLVRTNQIAAGGGAFFDKTFGAGGTQFQATITTVPTNGRSGNVLNADINNFAPPGGTKTSMTDEGFPQVAAFPVDTWFRLFMTIDLALGQMILGMNGKALVMKSGMTLTYTLANSRDWLCYLQAVPGARWQVGGARSIAGSDVPIVPDLSRQKMTNALSAPMWAHHDPLISAGSYWNYGASPAVTVARNSALGHVLMKTTGAYTTTSTLNVPALYNPEGWQTLATLVTVPSGTAQLVIRNAADTADLLNISMPAGGQMTVNGIAATTPAVDAFGAAIASVPINISAAKRYLLMVSMHRSGSAGVVLTDVTSLPEPPNTRLAWSYEVPGNPLGSGTMGKVKLVASAANTEWAAVTIDPYSFIITADSVSTLVTGTPFYVASNGFTRVLNIGDVASIPGHAYPGRQLGITPWRVTWAIGGPGMKHVNTRNLIYRFWNSARAVCYFLGDAFSVNDLSNGATSATILGFHTDLTTMAAARASKVISTTCGLRPPNEGAAHATKLMRLDIKKMNEKFAEIATANPGRYYLAETSDSLASETAVYTGGDGLHPNDVYPLAVGTVATFPRSPGEAPGRTGSVGAVSGANGSGLSTGTVTLSTGSGMAV